MHLNFFRHVTPKGFRVLSTLSTTGLVCKRRVSIVYLNVLNWLSEAANGLVSFVYELFTTETVVRA